MGILIFTCIHFVAVLHGEYGKPPESGKIPEPGLPEFRRIRDLELILCLLLNHVHADSKAAKLIIAKAKKLLAYE